MNAYTFRGSYCTVFASLSKGQLSKERICSSLEEQILFFKSRPHFEEPVHHPEKQTGISEKKQGAFIRLGAFSRFNTIYLIKQFNVKKNKSSSSDQHALANSADLDQVASLPGSALSISGSICRS